MRLTRCPVCRARLMGDEPLAEPCRRCGSDLSLVRAAERHAERADQAARAALAAGDAAAALHHARRAVALVDDERTRATLTAARALRAQRG